MGNEELGAFSAWTPPQKVMSQFLVREFAAISSASAASLPTATDCREAKRARRTSSAEHCVPCKDAEELT